MVGSDYFFNIIDKEFGTFGHSGIGSNLVGIQTSRLSTYLHSTNSGGGEKEECDNESLLLNEGEEDSASTIGPCVSPAVVFLSKGSRLLFQSFKG